IDKALCLSAAKKEEYEAFRLIRQPSFSRFTLHLHAPFSEGANYSPAPRGPQALFFPTCETVLAPHLLIQPYALSIRKKLWAWQQHWGIARFALLCSHL
ncbi:hypothetical protein, partial [Janthinobacterium sp. GW456P]